MKKLLIFLLALLTLVACDKKKKPVVKESYSEVVDTHDTLDAIINYYDYADASFNYLGMQTDLMGMLSKTEKMSERIEDKQLRDSITYQLRKMFMMILEDRWRIEHFFDNAEVDFLEDNPYLEKRYKRKE